MPQKNSKQLWAYEALIKYHNQTQCRLCYQLAPIIRYVLPLQCCSHVGGMYLCGVKRSTSQTHTQYTLSEYLSTRDLMKTCLMLWGDSEEKCHWELNPVLLSWAVHYHWDITTMQLKPEDPGLIPGFSLSSAIAVQHIFFFLIEAINQEFSFKYSYTNYRM